MASARHRFTQLELAAIGVSLAILSFLVIDPVVYETVRRLGSGTYTFFRSFTHLGRAHWILIPSGAAILVLAWLGANDTGFRSRIVKGYASKLLIFVFSAIALSGLSASLIKNVIGRARPKLFASHGPADFQPMTFDADFASFPSGHATTAGALAAILAILFPRWRVLILIAGAWVASTRMFIGAHYVSDVVVGFLFGALFVTMLRNRLGQRRWLFTRDRDGNAVLRGRRIFDRALSRLLGPFNRLVPNQSSDAAT